MCKILTLLFFFCKAIWYLLWILIVPSVKKCNLDQFQVNPARYNLLVVNSHFPHNSLLPRMAPKFLGYSRLCRWSLGGAKKGIHHRMIYSLSNLLYIIVHYCLLTVILPPFLHPLRCLISHLSRSRIPLPWPQWQWDPPSLPISASHLTIYYGQIYKHPWGSVWDSERVPLHLPLTPDSAVLLSLSHGMMMLTHPHSWRLLCEAGMTQ